MAVTTMPSTRSVLVPLIAIVLGSFMVILDNTVVNVALPTLGRVLDTNLSLLQWVISGYMLAQAAVIPLSGWLSDRFGAKRVYLASLVLFTLGSALCGLATNGEMLIATRILQGLGGGARYPGHPARPACVRRDLVRGQPVDHRRMDRLDDTRWRRDRTGCPGAVRLARAGHRRSGARAACVSGTRLHPWHSDPVGRDGRDVRDVLPDPAVSAAGAGLRCL